VVTNESLDPAYRALMLGLPSQSDLANTLYEAGKTPDPAALYDATESMRDVLASHLKDDLHALYKANQVTEPYAPDAEQSGKRALANAMLGLITRSEGADLAAKQYAEADNMTQQLAALANGIRAGQGDGMLAQFEEQWKDDRLVMDKWFGLQVMEADPEDAAATAERLTKHPDFNHKNPNRFRAVFGALAMHHAGFHHESGAAYTLLANWLITLDPLNPQTTARMCSAFQTWKRYDTDRQNKIKTEVARILATPDLSRDTTEMLTRIQGA
ncbi:MAG: aminopeptidase N C-terminal domain-containing protein, partial [Sulfitobacter sp.]|nr:aminopeptidase N C-terminal domain-containing protein [Sulfitobacter sp.]